MQSIQSPVDEQQVYQGRGRGRGQGQGEGSCGSHVRILLYVLIACIVAAIIFVVYRAVKIGRLYDDDEDETNDLSSSSSSYGENRDKNQNRFSLQRSSNRLYEGFEDEIAEEPGDEYDGAEARRVRDRSLQKERSRTGGGGSGSGKKGTVMYFHMDGCGHCRRFDPTWKEFVQKHSADLEKRGIELESHESGERIASDLDINGFPNVIFVSPSGEKTDQFQASRTIDELLKFARKHASSSSSS